MKLQHLAIIFIIIILPISMVITEYIHLQIDTISLQTSYNNKLQTATNDALKAFQLNTLNNKYSSVADSKIRDIEASIATFYNSIGTELGASGYDTESLQQFIPAMVYTMYDGYYIYGKYYNDNAIVIDDDGNTMYGDYQFGLKPFIYYSCRYKNSNTDIIVNYTLDNYITICGKVTNENGIEEYVSKSGVLINPDLVTDIELNGKSLKYNEVLIEPEILTENIVILDDNGYPEINNIDNSNNLPKVYEYTVYNNQKIDIDKEDHSGDTSHSNYFKNNNCEYFRVQNNKKVYITDSDSNMEEKSFLNTWTYNDHLYCNSAIEYYANAKTFSEWVQNTLGSISQQNAVDAEGNNIEDFDINTGKSNIFIFNDSDNDPMKDDSTFNQNRIAVIRRTIQSTLNSAIANYSSNANYEFAMPIFTEEDWAKLVNNVSVAVFMQGIPIGAKYYNNYCIITNNVNKEVVTKESIYVITGDNNNDIMDTLNEAHLPSAKDVIDGEKNIIGAYKIVDFEPQTVMGNEEYTYYPHANQKCYDCIVNYADTYDIDDVLDGTEGNENLRKIYLTALARERQNLYKTNDYLGI